MRLATPVNTVLIFLPGLFDHGNTRVVQSQFLECISQGIKLALVSGVQTSKDLNTVIIGTASSVIVPWAWQAWSQAMPQQAARRGKKCLRHVLRVMCACQGEYSRLDPSTYISVSIEWRNGSLTYSAPVGVCSGYINPMSITSYCSFVYALIILSPAHYVSSIVVMEGLTDLFWRIHRRF